MRPPIIIEKSECGAFMRLTFGSVVHIITISDWSNALFNTKKFMINAPKPIDTIKPVY